MFVFRRSNFLGGKASRLFPAHVLARDNHFVVASSVCISFFYCRVASKDLSSVGKACFRLDRSTVSICWLQIVFVPPCLFVDTVFWMGIIQRRRQVVPEDMCFCFCACNICSSIHDDIHVCQMLVSQEAVRV